MKIKNLDVKIRNAIKLNEKIYQLKFLTIKIALMTYSHLVIKVTANIVQKNSNMIDDDFDDEKNISSKIQLSFVVEKSMNLQIDLVFAYEKNKKLQIVMKIKRNDEQKISTKLIKKDMRLKLNDCKIKNNFL